MLITKLAVYAGFFATHWFAGSLAADAGHPVFAAWCYALGVLRVLAMLVAVVSTEQPPQ
jgi:hypothetical protein